MLSSPLTWTLVIVYLENTLHDELYLYGYIRGKIGIGLAISYLVTHDATSHSHSMLIQ